MYVIRLQHFIIMWKIIFKAAENWPRKRLNLRFHVGHAKKGHTQTETLENVNRLLGDIPWHNLKRNLFLRQNKTRICIESSFRGDISPDSSSWEKTTRKCLIIVSLNHRRRPEKMSISFFFKYMRPVSCQNVFDYYLQREIGWKKKIKFESNVMSAVRLWMMQHHGIIGRAI